MLRVDVCLFLQCFYPGFNVYVMAALSFISPGQTDRHGVVTHGMLKGVSLALLEQK
jgi:hypothetical protein